MPPEGHDCLAWGADYPTWGTRDFSGVFSKTLGGQTRVHWCHGRFVLASHTTHDGWRDVRDVNPKRVGPVPAYEGTTKPGDDE